MSDLYKEALADAAKIREIAEQDARNTILEKISPYIKQMIAKESSDLLLLEQEDMAPDTGSIDSGADSTETTVPSDMPIQASGDANVVNVPMPSGKDGKITLNFDDLFSKSGEDIINPTDVSQGSSMEVATATPSEPVAPAPEAAATPEAAPPAPEATPAPEVAAAPVAAPAEAGPTPAPETAGAAAEEEEAAPAAPAPVTEAKTIKQFERQLAEMAVKIDVLYTKNVSGLTKDAYKTKLFSLLEQLDKLAANKAITPRQAQLNENRLEFLFLHLKEANLNNSYKTKDKDTTMTTLKEFAAKLFESADDERLAQDSKSSGETGVPVHKKATAHAQSVDGVQADLFAGGSKTVEARHAAAGSVDSDELEGLEGEEGPWEQALMEEVEAALRDELDAHEERPEELPAAVKKSGYFEISEAALKKAIANIRKESASKKAKLREQAEGMEEDMVLSVELPDEVEEQLADEDLDVDLMFSGEEEEGEEGVVDLDMSDEGGTEEEEMLLTDEEEEGEEEEEMEEMAKPMMESRRSSVRKAILEARVREVKARRLAEAKRAEAATLKKEMAETNLFLSKLVYLNKFLVREDLSRKVKQQIVEHLDRASTIQEAKDIYAKINKKLDEAAAAHSAPVVGSASKPTTAGSARLNESVSRAATSNGSAEPVIGTFEKWQILANIKRNND